MHIGFVYFVFGLLPTEGIIQKTNGSNNIKEMDKSMQEANQLIILYGRIKDIRWNFFFIEGMKEALSDYFNYAIQKNYFHMYFRIQIIVQYNNLLLMTAFRYYYGENMQIFS